jgi:hypothetical protein
METIDKIISEMTSLSEKVSMEDKLSAALEFKVHPETINRYLRGEVKKEGFGLELLKFLKERVEKREQILHE